MAPAVIIDNEPDLDIPSLHPAKSATRTLLLAPPAVSAHPETLTRVAQAYDRRATDIQMLDRLSMGLVALPAATYDVILLLTDVDQSDSRLLDRAVMERLYQSMRVEGKLRTQSGKLGSADQTEAILAGLVEGKDGMTKPGHFAGQTVKLSFGKRKAKTAAALVNSTEAANTAKGNSEDISGTVASAPVGGIVSVTPSGVGFVDSLDDSNGGYDGGTSYEDDDMDMEIPSNDELERAEKIDPDTLLTEEDRQKPIVVPEACKPNTKRRRACKDCTCGLAQRLVAEDNAKRASADANLAKLQADDLAEVDFTVQGKVGSCGNCALGDAFRCDGCPYIGLPAFKPGEEVRVLNNDIQL